MKDKINQIIYILTNLILLLSMLFVGAPILENFTVVRVLVLVTMIAFKIVNLEKKICSNWFEVILFIFCLTSILPLITGSAISTKDSLISLSNMVCVYSFYYLIKNTINTPKRKNIFINEIIFGGIVIAFLGIDELSTNIFALLYDILQWPKVENIEQRMMSIFGYANTFAILMSFEIFLILHQYIKGNKIQKSIYSIAGFICLSGILLSESKAVLLIFAMVLFVLLILEKEKNKRIQIIEFLGIGLFTAVIYTKYFKEIVLGEQQYKVYIVLRNISCTSFLANTIIRAIK